jgi:hypothetical protein
VDASIVATGSDIAGTTSRSPVSTPEVDDRGAFEPQQFDGISSGARAARAVLGCDPPLRCSAGRISGSE